MADEPLPLPKRPRPLPACPVCARPPAAEHRPFCSRRCREVDLARWFRGTYRVPTEERDEGSEPAG